MDCTKQNSQPDAMPIKRKVDEPEKEFCPGSFHRKSVRCFRIERLFSFEGHKFVFGFYYARPHEVYCEPGKLFHKKEVCCFSFSMPFCACVVEKRFLGLFPSFHMLVLFIHQSFHSSTLPELNSTDGFVDHGKQADLVLILFESRPTAWLQVPLFLSV